MSTTRHPPSATLSRTPSLSARRRALLALCTTFTALTLVVGLTEIGLRIFSPQPVLLVSPGLYQPDPPRRYRLTPGFRGEISNRVEYRHSVRINRHGLRGAEVGERIAGRRRLLVLGDSFAFGVGAQEEESLPARLSARLATAPGGAWEVLNAGVPGYGVPDAAAWFEAYGRPLDPDLVLLVVFLGNDLQDAAPPTGRRVVAVDGVLMEEGESPRALRHRLYYGSHLYALLKRSPLADPVRALFGGAEPRDRREMRAEYALYCEAEAPAFVQSGLRATAAAAASLVASLGADRVLALLVPPWLEVSQERWRSGIERLGLDVSSCDRDRPARWVAEALSGAGVPSILAAAPLRRAAAAQAGTRVFYPIDQHLTPAGYDALAQVAAAHLLAR